MKEQDVKELARHESCWQIVGSLFCFERNGFIHQTAIVRHGSQPTEANSADASFSLMIIDGFLRRRRRGRSTDWNVWRPAWPKS